MLESLAPIYNLRDMLAEPTLFTSLALLLFSALNEIIALFPFSIVIASQLSFIEGGLTPNMITGLIFLVALPVGIGSAIGTLPLYTLSYLGGRPAINKYQKYLRFSWEDVENLTQRLRGEWYDEIILLVVRSIPILPSIPVTIVAGIIRVKFLSYILMSIVGFTLRMAFTLLIVWFSLGNLFKLIDFIYNV